MYTTLLGSNSTCLDNLVQVGSPHAVVHPYPPPHATCPPRGARSARHAGILLPRGGAPVNGRVAARRAAAAVARVKQYLKDALEAGRWAPGAQMPSEAELVAQFGVSRMTVHRALRELQDAGLITRLQGVGTFAAQLNRVSSTLTINDIQDEIRKRGHRHDATVHLKRAEPAPAALASAWA